MFGGEWMILAALVNTGLFVAAAGAVLVSLASHRLAERFGKGGWRTVALWIRRFAQALAWLLILAVLGTMLVIGVCVVNSIIVK